MAITAMDACAGRLLCASGRRATVVDAAAVAVRAEFAGRHVLTGAVFYPVDAGLLVVADRSGHVRLVDGSRMESALDLPVSSEMIGHLAISPANPTVVACSVSEEAGVRLVDLRSGARTHVLAYPSGARVTALAWSPCDPHVCVAGYTDEHVLLWDIRRPDPLHNVALSSATDHRRSMITGLRFSAFADTVFAAAANGLLHGVDVRTGRRGLSFVTDDYRRSPIQFTVINDWNCVAYPSGPGALLFGLESARLPPVGNVQSGLADVTALAFDRDLLTLFSGDSDGVVVVHRPVWSSPAESDSAPGDLG
ncbi:hypothetical protein PBRA_006691 [Plasmodiophora brassicae]|uniref:Anaphase-promoting complex subunit 4 WD40 domain-containing protein n=1 Tax=Plasmodiophora brassicae TaxID=37360 RepID=A0A0G4ITK9_PLABS|nr:hypothetical protein PBRA_006691 [Plasmodiophora brassicae]